ncbi:DUF4382 domain-containing protein [Shewanella maritima]|uniref:DUF4382 domain-containing protein n=1 Tax=Shewanella maritima TaxID=2520507 RepID=UPI0037351828
MKSLGLSKVTVAVSLGLLVSACGSDSSDPAPQTGQFSLGVSDNPADANVVNIAFKQVVLKNSDGAISFNVDVDETGLQHVDLLSVQGSAIETLVSGQEVPVGEYQMCIYMQNNEVESTDSSYVLSQATFDPDTQEWVGGVVEGLTTNSNGSCGGEGAEEEDTGRLFFNKSFTIAAGNNAFVAEFNLTKGLQGPKGNKDYWTLKPTAVQLVNTADVGAISGMISPQTMTDCETAAAGSEFAEAVYLYPESTTLEQMADFREGEYAEGEVAPIASARVNPVLDDNGQVQGYQYEFGFVSAATYSLGYTCLAQNDDPEDTNVSEPDDGSAVFFLNAAEIDVSVEDGATTERNFPMGYSPQG